jgi:hypothetical protein
MKLWRTAKSCGPDTPTLVSSLLDDQQATVAKEPGHRGEHEISRSTVAQGVSDCFGEPVVTCSCAFFILHARLRVRRAPGIPCALCFSRDTLISNSGESCRENADARHCDERSDDPPSLTMRAMAGLESAEAPLRVGGSNPHYFLDDFSGLLREACHRARIRATRWLAMTAYNRSPDELFEIRIRKSGRSSLCARPRRDRTLATRDNSSPA